MFTKFLKNKNSESVGDQPSKQIFSAKFNKLPSSIKIIIFVGTILLMLLMPYLGRWWTRVLMNTGLMLMCALGLNVILGNVGQFFLGYIAFYGVGAYMYAILASPHRGIHLPFLLIFVLAGIATGLLGALLSWPTARLRGDYLALVTLAFGEVFFLIATNLELTNGAIGITRIDKPNIFGLQITTPQHYYYLILILVIMEIFILSRFAKSRIGRAMVAIREDEDAASAIGLNTTKLKILGNGIGSIFGGLAGVIFAASQGFVSTVNFSTAYSTLLLSYIVVGGTGNVYGVILGTLLLTIIPEPLRQYTSNYRMLFYALVLLIFTVRRPQGVWPGSSRISDIPEDKINGYMNQDISLSISNIKNVSDNKAD